MRYLWFFILALSAELAFQDEILKENSNKPEIRAKEMCDEVLGCFSSGGDFYHPVYRPIDLVPQDRQKINTRFYLYTRDSPKEHYLLKAEDNRTLEHFPKGKPLKVIVHGYIDNQLFGEWMRDMKDEFLLSGDMNVVIVDWSGGNGMPYFQASANTRIVGAEIAMLVNKMLKEVYQDPKTVHILGHSLGSHVAGYAGERIPSLGRITAMDPAEPYFQNMPPTVRIDEKDADFVDVVHTDSKSILLLGLGMSQLVGNVDIFPNGGKEQPGCAADKITTIITDGLVEGVRNFVSCNHQRAVKFVHDTINQKRCLPVGYLCKDWSTFLSGECGSCGPEGRNCAVLGYRADQYWKPQANEEHKTFYLKTNSDPPYCLYHFQVVLALNSDSKNQDGEVTVKIIGSEATQTFTLGDGKIELNGGETYKFLLTTQVHLGDIQSVVLAWEVRKLLPSIIKPKLIVDKLTIKPMNEILPEKMKEYQYCLSNHPIKSKESLTLNSIFFCDAKGIKKKPRNILKPSKGSLGQHSKSKHQQIEKGSKH